MKNIVDVMSLQQQRVEAIKQQQGKPIDYRKVNKPGAAAHFLFECAIKLEIKPLTSATAAHIFHQFNNEIKTSDYDEYLTASACLYLAGKLKDDPVKIRDVINVAHCTLNRNSAPMELDDEYWSFRDAIVQAELFIARTIKYDLNIELPHKYLLYYMKCLQDWLGSEVWCSVPIAKTAASYLQDFHHNPKVIKHKPSHIAICCLSLSLQTYGVQVPLTDEADDSTMWYSVFAEDMTHEIHWEIVEDIIEVYKQQADIQATKNN